MSLSDFRVIVKIGEGSFSSVHKVRRLSDNKEYALKKVRLGMLKEKEKQNSLNEVRILASIENPYIVSYKDAFIDENCLCVVMEYAEGGDLQAKIKDFQRKHSHMKESEVWKLITHMVTGLQLLHSMEIMHRDLKSANVFISGDVYKLGDLNVSKIVKDKLAYTQTGTPYYASPEVWRDQPYDVKSDIWSLGCVIYEVCALVPPFQAKDMSGLYKKVQRGTFDRIPRHYSAELQKFIELCLQLAPTKRPNCKQLLAYPSLNKFLSSPSERENYLLETIKLPKNLKHLKDKLPKSKYESDAVSQRERVSSQNSEVANRYRTDSSNVENIQNILPSIGKIRLSRDRIVSSIVESPKKYPVSQRNLVLKSLNEPSSEKIKDQLRERQKIQELIEMKKERVSRDDSLPTSLQKKPISRLLPLYVEQKPENYIPPAWWG